MNAQTYVITCLTNMHAGTGAADQGVIDNLVQRDHTDRLPCIYASSLKGAFREYFEEYLVKKKKELLEQDCVARIFGGKRGKENTGNATSRGTHIFYDAVLLSVPVRSNKALFYQATSWGCIARIVEMCKMLNGDNELKGIIEAFEALSKIGKECEKVYCNFEPEAGLRFEFWLGNEYETAPYEGLLRKYLGDKFIILPDRDFEILVSDCYLPVIARNQLESGISKNLFYEQVIPRQSRFVFWTSMFPDSQGTSDEFNKVFEKTDSGKPDLLPVQIGANASIGYGYCAVEALVCSVESKKC